MVILVTGILPDGRDKCTAPGMFGNLCVSSPRSFKLNGVEYIRGWPSEGVSVQPASILARGATSVNNSKTSGGYRTMHENRRLRQT